MATTNERRSYAIQAMNSLAPQVDEIRLYDNSAERHDYTDNAKFYYLSHYREPIYYFSCDDDIIYPADYVSKTIEAIEKHKTIVTYHGRRLTGLDRSYYRGHLPYALNNLIPRDVKIDIAGTGCSAFRTDYFNPVELYRSNDKKMCDLVFSLEAAKQEKEITIINHKADDFKILDIPKELTIFEEMKDNQKRLIELANEIWKENKLKHT